MADRKVAAVGPVGAAAALGIAAARIAERFRQAVLGIDRRHLIEPTLDIADQRQAGPREGTGANRERRLQTGDGFAAGSGDGNL